ncbi:hypothetical protein [Sphingosinithalassobacter sp. LHW66-3]|uniref:hypothetical protein n=1 Tax=Sphingosinithalassobacter sp. LHW66-3 TaxID=3424718 RepID=UPI003D6B88AE
MIRRPHLLLAALLPLALAACSGGSEQTNADTMDGENVTDPALASALQDQIMVDPSLSQQANGDSVRPPAQPYSGAVPPEGVAANGSTIEGELMRAPAPVQAGSDCEQCQNARESVTLGGLAARQQNRELGGCAADLQYSASWAERLPRDIPLYPHARVVEAAGADGAACQLRVVTFSSPAPMQTMLDWYYTKAVRAGFTAEHQVDGAEHILGGTRERDDSAYVLFMTPRPDGGTDIDLVANNGV